MSQPELAPLIGKMVVIDTDSAYVYIGRLETIGADFLNLSEVDVHDTTDSKATKEHYAHETRKLGLRKNRAAVLVRVARVVSVSLLDDVITF